MPNTGKIVALPSNDVVFLAWQFRKEILDCLGFTVRRRHLNAKPSSFQALPAWVGWEGGSNENWEPKTKDVGQYRNSGAPFFAAGRGFGAYFRSCHPHTTDGQPLPSELIQRQDLWPPQWIPLRDRKRTARIPLHSGEVSLKREAP